MSDHINKKTIGILVITLSLFAWMLDRMTQYVSMLLGKVMCEEHYNHVSNDSSCGFNIEMHLAYSLFTVLILGIVLYISSRKEVE